MNTVQEQWSAFSKLVMPNDAPAIQRQEMRRAFYAGAEGMMKMLTGPLPDMSDDAGVAMIEGWRQELAMFARDVEAGRA